MWKVESDEAEWFELLFNRCEASTRGLQFAVEPWLDRSSGIEGMASVGTLLSLDPSIERRERSSKTCCTGPSIGSNL